jgi:ribosome-associated translation inhibitor RaiA
MTDELDFTLELHTEVQALSDIVEAELWDEADTRLRALVQGHTDLTGASVVIDEPAHTERPYIYRARVVAYIRPEDIVAVEKADSMLAALKGALTAVERQVREKREKLGRRWQQP